MGTTNVVGPNSPVTAEGQRAGAVGAASSTVKPPVAAPVPVTPPAPPRPASSLAGPAPTSMSAQINAVQATKVSLPAGLVSKNTKNITSPWFRLLLYGETDARKTTTAVKFGTPEQVRIVANRGEDQLDPLRELGYEYVLCDNMEKFRFSLMYPEKIWPDWAARNDRILVIDDLTKAKEMMLEENELDDKGRQRNQMLVHREAKGDMAQVMKSAFSKPQHVIGVAFAQIYENAITHEENVGPDLPPSMNRMLTADFTYVFYIDKVKWMLRTTSCRETYEDLDEKMAKKTFTRVYFAKHKLPVGLEGKGVVNDLEKMDLKEVWRKIREGKK